MMGKDESVELFMELLIEVREVFPDGIEVLQLMTLLAVAQEGNQTLSEIAETLHCERSTVSRNVARLGNYGTRTGMTEGARLVNETPDLQDRRFKRVNLTDEGAAVVRSLAETAHRVTARQNRRAERGNKAS